MLTKEELEVVTDAIECPGLLGDHDITSLVAIIARLQTPRAVLGEAERLLKALRARRVDFIGGGTSITGVRVERPGGQQCGPGESYARADSLADAYERLTDSKTQEGGANGP